jgi:hypothetical protein
LCDLEESDDDSDDSIKPRYEFKVRSHAIIHSLYIGNISRVKAESISLIDIGSINGLVCFELSKLTIGKTLVELPHSFPRTLKSLILSPGTNVSMLPLSYGNLVNLEELFIEGHNMLEFPVCILSMLRLTHLTLCNMSPRNGRSMFPTLPPNFGASLPKLMTLNFSYSGLVELPSLQVLYMLESIELYGNRIQQLDLRVFPRYLQSLNVASNPVCSVVSRDNTFDGMTEMNLKYTNMSDMIDVQNIISCVNQSCHVNLSGCIRLPIPSLSTKFVARDYKTLCNTPMANMANKKQKANNTESKYSLCVVCWVNEATHAILPCGHLCLCGNESLDRLKICPICRGKCTSKARIYI